MKNWNDFFDEEPPQGHASKVMNAVQKDLEAAALKTKRNFFAEIFSAGRSLSIAGGAAAAFVGFWMVTKGRRSSDKNQELELAAFQQSLGADVQAQDLEILASAEDEIEFLENLDLLEEMEDV